MGFLDDAKESAEAVAKKTRRAVEDGIDEAKDNLAELKAEAAVKKAEAERDSVKARNEAKEDLRED